MTTLGKDREIFGETRDVGTAEGLRCEACQADVAPDERGTTPQSHCRKPLPTLKNPLRKSGEILC